MRSARIAGSVALLAVVAACGRSPAATEPDLVGYWILPARETPAVYGLTSAQVIFRPDGTFLFQGTNPLSQSPLGEFTVTGTWTRAGDRVTLDSGDEARTWTVAFDGPHVRFVDPENEETFTLFRPGPD